MKYSTDHLRQACKNKPLGYVLTNYTIQCKDQVSGKTGCFLFDTEKYSQGKGFYAISDVFSDLAALYAGTTEAQRQSCYIERFV